MTEIQEYLVTRGGRCGLWMGGLEGITYSLTSKLSIVSHRRGVVYNVQCKISARCLRVKQCYPAVNSNQ